MFQQGTGGQVQSLASSYGQTQVAAMLQIDSAEDCMNVERDDEMDDGISPWTEQSTNGIMVHHAICTCGKWQDHKYPCQHTMTHFCKGKNLSFKDIL